MRVEKITVLANRKVDLQLRIFVRSLRETDCDLPVFVIPYGPRDFELPAGCEWLERPSLSAFLRERSAHPLYSKYIALLEPRSAYFDTDIVVLQNPTEWLKAAPGDAFVVADTEWAKNRWTFSDDSRGFLASLTSRWPLMTFNSGFFAFEDPLYSEAELRETVELPEMKKTCLERKRSPIDQPALNWLVLRKQRKIFNFNLPPQEMESTIAFDYGLEEPEEILARPNAPAFLHCAGPIFETDLPSTQLYLSYLTAAERREWDAEVGRRKVASRWLREWPLWVRFLNRLVRMVDGRFFVQPKL